MAEVSPANTTSGHLYCSHEIGKSHPQLPLHSSLTAQAFLLTLSFVSTLALIPPPKSFFTILILFCADRCQITTWLIAALLILSVVCVCICIHIYMYIIGIKSTVFLEEVHHLEKYFQRISWGISENDKHSVNWITREPRHFSYKHINFWSWSFFHERLNLEVDSKESYKHQSEEVSLQSRSWILDLKLWELIKCASFRRGHCTSSQDH